MAPNSDKTFESSTNVKPTTSLQAFDPESGPNQETFATLGYKQELKRNLGLTTILGLSFSIIAAPVSTEFLSSAYVQRTREAKRLKMEDFPRFP